MKKVTKYIGMIAAGMAFMAMPSCTDTWDDHYNGGEGEVATVSLWKQIQAKPELSRFADLAQKAVYYKDRTHPLINPNTGLPYTYAEALDGTQIMTVWAPTNDALSEQDYQLWLQEAEESPYRLHQQLMGNTTALWRHNISNAAIDTLEMLNGKKFVFDRAKGTMHGVNIIEKNISASNGTLHTIEKSLAFNYNIYEFVKDKATAMEEGIENFHKYILSTDTTYFSEGSSIEGPTNADGQPTYVDSVYFNTNTMFFSTHRVTNTNPDRNLTYLESFGANIEAEDSDFVMIIPNDIAWEAAYNKLKPLYNYATSYIDNEKINLGAEEKTTETRNIDATEMDSIVNQNILQDMISPLCFNAHRQPKLAPSAPLWTSSTLLSASDADVKYLINTFGDTIRTDNEWQKMSIFEGQDTTMSNGHAIVSNNWNIPSKLYQPNINIEVNYSSIYNLSNYTVNSRIESYTTTAAKTDTLGSVSHNNYYNFVSNKPSGSPDIEFKLIGSRSLSENFESEVMSGTYDIYAVLVPTMLMVEDSSQIVRHKFTAELTYQGDKNGKVSKISEKKKDIYYMGEKIDSVLLFENFKFPYSYKNLRFSYPTLKISTQLANNTDKKTYTGTWAQNYIAIDRIILVAKEN